VNVGFVFLIFIPFLDGHVGDSKRLRHAIRGVTKELDDPDQVFAIWLVFPTLPVVQRALVHAKDHLAFNGCHLQIEPVLLDLLANMPWMGWIEV